MKITPQLLQKLGYPGMPLAVAQEWAAALNAAAVRFEIDTPLRLAHWLSQLMHESVGLKFTREIWGPTPAQLGYEGRANLGNTQPGDGKRYMGRGPIQVTGRANYRTYGRRLGYDLEGNPQLAEQPTIGALIAGDYWASHGLNSRADLGGDSQVETISAAINGRNRFTNKPNGLPDRLARFRQAWAVLSATPPQVLLVPKGEGDPEPVAWDGKPAKYDGVLLDAALVEQLRLVYPEPGGPWTYQGLTVWRRRSGDLVLKRSK
ncbi:glycoside hydrolase family 19 protein [Deinococcus sp. Leaf326]|uniref:glycoside hydrolase family 19 protein n=1 Tax=Deinococcus sp. Leaf326 TaxID=1736338 RepID=UPI0009EA37F2|nr:glycoside hydrolase family 19 protein [Deinococcus sp. Leaf326]